VTRRAALSAFPLEARRRVRHDRRKVASAVRAGCWCAWT